MTLFRAEGRCDPDGLARDEIPIEARSVAVADVFDALISVRPYKRAWSFDEALDFISAHSGKLFDPRCVDALLRGRERLMEIFANSGSGVAPEGLQSAYRRCIPCFNRRSRVPTLAPPARTGRSRHEWP